MPMKLKDYAKRIALLAKKYPNVDLVYASDNEGNSFHNVFYSPAIGEMDGEMFINYEPDSKAKPTTCCIN
jgi:hypothetical protein